MNSLKVQNRVSITDNANEFLQQLIKKHGPDLIFHQSGGCCDGSAPMLLKRSEIYLDNNDVSLGYVGGIEFYMHKDQYEYWKYTHITIDITKGRGSSFSLEIPEGYRFIIHSKLLDEN